MEGGSGQQKRGGQDPLSGRGQPAGGIHPRSRRSADHIQQRESGRATEHRRGALPTPVVPAARWYLCETGRAGGGEPNQSIRHGRPFNNQNHVEDGVSGGAGSDGPRRGGTGRGAAAVTEPPDNQMLFIMVAAPLRGRKRKIILGRHNSAANGNL